MYSCVSCATCGGARPPRARERQPSARLVPCTVPCALDWEWGVCAPPRTSGVAVRPVPMAQTGSYAMTTSFIISAETPLRPSVSCGAGRTMRTPRSAPPRRARAAQRRQAKRRRRAHAHLHVAHVE
eukprot:5480248-Prymnesium_polylepis.2